MMHVDEDRPENTVLSKAPSTLGHICGILLSVYTLSSFVLSVSIWILAFFEIYPLLIFHGFFFELFTIAYEMEHFPNLDKTIVQIVILSNFFALASFITAFVSAIYTRENRAIVDQGKNLVKMRFLLVLTVYSCLMRWFLLYKLSNVSLFELPDESINRVAVAAILSLSMMSCFVGMGIAAILAIAFLQKRTQT